MTSSKFELKFKSDSLSNLNLKSDTLHDHVTSVNVCMMSESRMENENAPALGCWGICFQIFIYVFYIP